MIIENQQKAIDSRCDNILLSASAGTGKTYTMVERIISLLKDGHDISSFLVLAFGNDASKEMKDRVEKGILKLAKQDSKYHAQLKKLKIASISTIHSFALEIAKSYFAVSGASPKAKVLLGADEDVLKATAMDKVFLDCYENSDENFLSLVEYFIQKRKDDALKGYIYKLYTFSRNMPKGDFEKAFFTSFEDRTLEKIYLDGVKKKCLNLLENYLLSSPLHEIYTRQYQQCENVLRGILSSNSLLDVYHISQTEFLRKTNPKKDDPESWGLICENFYTLVRERIKDYIRKLKSNLAEAFCDGDFSKEYRKVASSLFEITNKFESEYAQMKAKKDYVDFSDTEHMLLAVLKDEKSRAELTDRYKFIFCDEYQDVSKIQEEILTLISSCGNLFVVGDIKQNIYGFRACDQTVIKNRENSILQSGNGLLLPMNTNFRSHRDILEFTNSVFSVAMNNPSICEYEKTSMFEACASFEDLGGVEIAIATQGDKPETERLDVYSVEADKGAPREEINAETEGRYIAKFIRKYLGKPFAFPSGTRDVRLSDFAILIRNVSGKFAPTISHVLEQNNLPNFILSSESTLQSHTKVLFLVDFLKVIDSPFDDVPLYSTLVSPFLEIDDGTLLNIRNANKQKYFHESFFGFAKDVATKYNLPPRPFARENIAVVENQTPFIDAIENLKISLDFAGNGCEKDISQDIFSVDFHAVLENETATNEELAVAKFMTAHHRYRTLACLSCVDMIKTAIAENSVQEKITLAFGEVEWQYASELINFLAGIPTCSVAIACEKLEKAISTMKLSGSFAVPNAISIMTMHKSKGLEFPFTIIAGTGKSYNTQDFKSQVLFHKDYGISFSRRDIETRKATSTIDKIAMKNILLDNAKDEELRLLYVALTRAKFKLLITGTLDFEFDIKDNIAISKDIPIFHSASDLYSLNSHMKVILSALASSKYKSNYTLSRMFDSEEDFVAEKVEFEAGTNASASLANKLTKEENKLSYNVLPVKFTATQRLESFAKKVEEENLPALEKYEVQKVIDFSKNKADIFKYGEMPPTKAQMGTCYHKILEEVPFYSTEDEIRKFIAGMIEREEVFDIAYDYKKIHNLTNNEIFGGSTPHREVPFVMEMESEKFDLPAGDTVLCQGVIDCVFQKENGDLILLDYKATTIKNPDVLRKKYFKQLETYKIACEKILHARVEKCFIYSIFFEELIEIFC